MATRSPKFARKQTEIVRSCARSRLGKFQITWLDLVVYVVAGPVKDRRSTRGQGQIILERRRPSRYKPEIFRRRRRVAVLLRRFGRVHFSK